MNREEKERLERRRRMLARERGEAPPTPPPASKQQPERERPAPERSAPSTLPPKEQGAAAAPAATLRPISPILRRRQCRRRIAVVLVVLIIAAIMAVGSGLLGTSIAMLGDMTDSISLYLNRAGAGWPANTGIRTPTQVEPWRAVLWRWIMRMWRSIPLTAQRSAPSSPAMPARRWPWATPALCCITAQARS